MKYTGSGLLCRNCGIRGNPVEALGKAGLTWDGRVKPRSGGTSTQAKGGLEWATLELELATFGLTDSGFLLDD
jgi:hypothetical protein